jgi:hypothetical protein
MGFSGILASIANRLVSGMGLPTTGTGVTGLLSRMSIGKPGKGNRMMRGFNHPRDLTLGLW